jgi:putative membrane protein
MVGLDFLIEPVAIKYDYWAWAEVAVPVQNYIAWFFISLVLHWFFKLQMGKVKNPIAPFIIIAQVIYFGLLNLL